MSASQDGHVEVVDRLLQHGAREDLQNKVYLDADIVIMHVIVCT